MAFDYSKAVIADNNATGDTNGNVGSPNNVGTSNDRALDQAGACVQLQSGSSTYSGRYKNLANLDLSSGVFIGHIGHNSPYRTFADGFARWRFYSGGSTSTDYVEFDTFSIATVGDDPRTIAHVMDLNAVPSRSDGSFDPTNVTRVQYSEARNSAAPQTVLIYLSFWTHAPSDNSANTPKIHGTTSIEIFIRELRNDNFGLGLGGPTGNGQLTDAVRNTSALLSFNMPVAFGKTGVATIIDGTGFDYQIGVNSTLYHLTGQGILWTNNWDIAIAGQSLDMSGTTVSMLTPSDWTVFDVDSGNVSINISGMSLSNAGDIRLGASCTGLPAVIEMGSGKTLTTPNAVDYYNVTGTLQFEGSTTAIVGLNATRLVLTQPGTYTLTDCDITEVENVSGGSITLTTNTAIGSVIETNGSITLIDALLNFQNAGDWTVFSSSADRDAGANPIASGLAAETFAFAYVPATTYYFRIVRGGVTFLVEDTPAAAGETAIALTAEALLSALPSAANVVSALKPDLTVINNGVKKSSLIVPHTESLS